MRAVAIKMGQSKEKAVGVQEMGTLRCDGCGEEFFIAQIPHSRISGSLRNKHTASKGFLRRNTSATRNTLTESNCRTDRGKVAVQISCIRRNTEPRFPPALTCR
jgi:hypothetical protein